MGMLDIALPWGPDAPEPLLQLCVQNIVHNPNIICDKPSNGVGWKLKEQIALPEEMCEKLLDAKQESSPQELDYDFVSIFKDIEATRVKRANVRNSNITDDGLLILLHHRLVELDIHNCQLLTSTSLDHLRAYGATLKSLVLTEHILPKKLSSQAQKELIECGSVIDLPNLRKLVLNNFTPSRGIEIFPFLLRPLDNLVHLDLSNCSGLGDLTYASHLVHLRSLFIHNVPSVPEIIPTIYQMKNLRKLDISQLILDNGEFISPDETLDAIMQNLPNLTHLDISGTNLSGKGSFKTQPENSDDGACDIAGLQCRVRRPLEFLGLYNTHHSACQRFSIPAKVIAGEANEDQVLAATEAYIDRPLMLIKAMNELFHIFRYEHCVKYEYALQLILHAMSRHRSERHIQIAGSASLFYITKNDKNKLGLFERRKLISVLLDGMERHMDDATMMRNGCLTFCQFRMPDFMMCNYKRLVNILLMLVKGEHDVDDFVRRIAIFILNTLACQVDGQHKLLVGDLGAIETMLSLIKERLRQNNHDDVLDIAWSAMWNVTDETPVNCERFLDGSGMTYFLQCLEAFPDKEELLRNMMGLLGNVAEVEHLRPRLLNHVFISTFAHLLNSHSDGIEVSYNAAGVLSHIMSDGPEKWSISEPRREEVLLRIVIAIQRWDINSMRNINYRSFEPILRLLQVEHTPECQHWAVWALANLTKMYPDKYCILLEEENGITLLENVLRNSTNDNIRTLAQLALTNCQKYKTESASKAEEILNQ